MGIINNADIVLLCIYDLYVKREEIDIYSLLKETKLKGLELDRALKYLRDKYLIKYVNIMGDEEGCQLIIFHSITPLGIACIEK